MKYLQKLFAQKTWANHELFNALAAIPDGVHAWYMQYVQHCPASELGEAIRFRFTDGDAGETPARPSHQISPCH